MQLKHRFPPPQQFSVTPTTILSECEHNYSKRFPSFWQMVFYMVPTQQTPNPPHPLPPTSSLYNSTPFKPSHPSPPPTPSSISINNSIYILAFPLLNYHNTEKPQSTQPPSNITFEHPSPAKTLTTQQFPPPNLDLSVHHPHLHPDSPPPNIPYPLQQNPPTQNHPSSHPSTTPSPITHSPIHQSYPTPLHPQTPHPFYPMSWRRWHSSQLL